MPEWLYIGLAVLISAAITWSLRALPFLLLNRLEDSELLPYLSAHMPVGIMTILVFYTLRHTELAPTPQTLAVVVGLAVTAVLHGWRRNAVLSVFSGTACHVAVLVVLG